MSTAREYLFSKGLAKAATGRGRFSGAAHEELARARKAGIQFSDDAPTVEKTKAVTVAKAPKVVAVKPTEKYDNSEVRKWARDNGHTVGERGRIHIDLINAYLAGTKTEERPEVVTELDVFGPTFSGRYPKGTKFVAEFPHKGKTVTMTVSDRTACFDCGVSLSGHKCNQPRMVTGFGNDPVELTVIMPKGVSVS